MDVLAATSEEFAADVRKGIGPRRPSGWTGSGEAR